MKKLNIYLNKITLVISIILCTSVLASSCKKFVTVDPPINALEGTVVFTDDATATAALLGIYSKIMENPAQSIAAGNQSITLFAGVSSDEQQVYATTPALIEYGQNNLLPTNTINQIIWRDAYSYIYSANSIIEGLSITSGVSDGIKKQMTGEARFIRAFLHFYLLNLYGSIPYVTTTDFRVNQSVSRMPVADVYSKIIEDLTESQNLLTSNYSFANNERTRPTKMAASALLARVYLYTGNWAKAESEASTLISNVTLYNLASISQVFLKNSREAIWQLEPIYPQFSTGEGFTYIFTSRPTRTALTTSIVNSFETGDTRRVNWVGSKVSSNVTYYHPFKYKERIVTTPPGEYLMVLRLAEQYLIRAEARANLDNISGAKSDLNVIRTRAGLSSTIATDKSSLLLAIEKERRVELFAEWGHRWLDLKRTMRADPVLSILKGASWQTTDQLYPIPQIELDRDPNLKPQNPGY